MPPSRFSFDRYAPSQLISERGHSNIKVTILHGGAFNWISSQQLVGDREKEEVVMAKLYVSICHFFCSKKISFHLLLLALARVGNGAFVQTRADLKVKYNTGA